uniref:COesterase domain-containing protein n=1 Tax=Globodera pallida TaxID=36090 RepID=A0A183CNP3_GLOPA
MALLFRSKVLVGLCVLSLFIATAFASFGGPFDFFGAAPFDPMPVPIVPPPLPPPPPPPPPPVVYVKKRKCNLKKKPDQGVDKT